MSSPTPLPDSSPIEGQSQRTETKQILVGFITYHPPKSNMSDSHPDPPSPHRPVWPL